MFKLSAACVLATVAAAQYQGYPQQHQGYYPQQHQGYYPQQHQHQGYYPQYPQHGQHNHNPWGPPAPVEPVKPDGWYTATMEFKPPAIQYMPAQSYMTEWATCDMGNVKLQMSQRPGKAIAVMGMASGCPIAQEYELLVAKYGQCSEEMPRSPMNMEFNPLEEKDKMGEVVMYQDPSRGRLDGFTTDAEGAANASIGNWPIQFNFLQNLSGHESLIGRDVYLVEVNTDEDTGVVTKEEGSCCVIGRDMAPEGYVEPRPQYNYYGRPAPKKGGKKSQPRYSAPQPFW